MARTDTTEGQALWQPRGAEEDSCLREGGRPLRLVYDGDEEVIHVIKDEYPDSAPARRLA